MLCSKLVLFLYAHRTLLVRSGALDSGLVGKRFLAIYFTFRACEQIKVVFTDRAETCTRGSIR